MTGDEFNIFEIAHFRLLGDDKYLPYGSCLLSDTCIKTNKGIKEIKDIVIKALEKLDSKDRTVLSLFYLDNMKTKDISFLLNESEESVRTRLSRARVKLKEVIEDGKV